MLITNRHQTEIWFNSNPDPKFPGREYHTSDYIMDVEGNVENELSEKSYEDMRKLHKLVYDDLYDEIRCEETSTSYYDDSCFHLVASDVGLD